MDAEAALEGLFGPRRCLARGQRGRESIADRAVVKLLGDPGGRPRDALAGELLFVEESAGVNDGQHRPGIDARSNIGIFMDGQEELQKGIELSDLLCLEALIGQLEVISPLGMHIRWVLAVLVRDLQLGNVRGDLFDGRESRGGCCSGRGRWGRGLGQKIEIVLATALIPVQVGNQIGEQGTQSKLRVHGVDETGVWDVRWTDSESDSICWLVGPSAAKDASGSREK
ncbi:uncharacterized protein BJ171DRAFT_97902 [Polychytrium aggregatum]|uniref:uncharacterized protein n=1 Tax=Polychytrium aggregatum TaxID=110093 RepID=UPI0022FE73AF|nr:uncharacterized protein BJ171DRAFT_97902 [Polychytrium aggregatum]KAI9204562.1 hypothetical protein BJ171DRAFT_97902 [Polychytrium aggregatum]